MSSLTAQNSQSVQEAYFPSYPTYNYAGSSTNPPPAVADEDGEELSPEDDPLATRGIPIFRPTLEDFEVSFRTVRLTFLNRSTRTSKAM